VHVTDSVPQPLVLEAADLFVTHGGYDGIREALRSGVPVVVHPQNQDQPHNAARVAELGLGVAVTDPDAGELAKAAGGAARAAVPGPVRCLPWTVGDADANTVLRAVRGHRVLRDRPGGHRRVT
jgi:hypothetical protein